MHERREGLLNMASRVKYTKELLQTAVAENLSVAGVLRFLNLKQAGGNKAHISRKLV